MKVMANRGMSEGESDSESSDDEDRIIEFASSDSEEEMEDV